MPEYKSIPTKVGDFPIETLDTKAPPQRIPSAKEQQQYRRRHAKRQRRYKHALHLAHRHSQKDTQRQQVKNNRLDQKVRDWADQHLPIEAKTDFFRALGQYDYDAAYAVLQDSWNNIAVATFYQLYYQWPKWRSNFSPKSATRP